MDRNEAIRSVTALSQYGSEGIGSDFLDSLIDMDSPRHLEEGVKLIISFLEELKDLLTEASLPGASEATHWTKKIEDTQAKCQLPRFTIAVVGKTGAGKSSLINALIDEEQLLPSSCLRACTACATEISFNTSDDPRELYRAQIEFISLDDWEQELKCLLPDLTDGKGTLSKDFKNPDSPAGFAYSKIVAVYPELKLDEIVKQTPELLARQPRVTELLGKVRDINQETSKALYLNIQRYVDSPEKHQNAEIQYWPLIKVVRIYTKAQVLQTGAVIVDLPGVEDNNAARAAVSTKYMKTCSRVWVVAESIRAVDDKIAKTLLNDAFRRQMKFDGKLDTITFICSKADEISVPEVENSLNINGEKRSQIETLVAEKASIDGDISRMKANETTILNKITQLNTDTLKKTNDLLQPRSSQSMSVSSGDDSKRRKISSSDYDDPGGVMTSFKSRYQDLHNDQKNIETNLKDLDEQLHQNVMQKKNLDLKRTAACIKARNEHTKETIRIDFVLGMRELDEQDAENDEENFDPDEDLQDYEQYEHNLHVICVSTRAYQKLCGRLEKDLFQAHGFASLDDTEIPQLQQHARDLAECSMTCFRRDYLREVKQLLVLMELWALDDNTTSNDISKTEEGKRETVLRAALSCLDREMLLASEKYLAKVVDILNEEIVLRFEKTIDIASKQAIETASTWNCRGDEGGLSWNTYQATCRREGRFTSSFKDRKSHNLNAKLIDPIKERLQGGWDRAFQALSLELVEFKDSFQTSLNNFHRQAVRCSGNASDDEKKRKTLERLLTAGKGAVGITSRDIRSESWPARINAHEAFTPIITEVMQSVYQFCAAQKGKGMLQRMRNEMMAHIEKNWPGMFAQAITEVHRQLIELCESVQKMIDDLKEETYRDFGQKYRRALLPNDTAADDLRARAERLLRHKIGSLLADKDSAFEVLFRTEMT